MLNKENIFIYENVDLSHLNKLLKNKKQRTDLTADEKKNMLNNILRSSIFIIHAA